MLWMRHATLCLQAVPRAWGVFPLPCLLGKLLGHPLWWSTGCFTCASPLPLWKNILLLPLVPQGSSSPRGALSGRCNHPLTCSWWVFKCRWGQRPIREVDLSPRDFPGLLFHWMTRVQGQALVSEGEVTSNKHLGLNSLFFFFGVWILKSECQFWEVEL